MRSAIQRQLAATFLLAGALVVLCSGDALAATQRSRLEVERAGFRGVYKVGYWTPVWVKVLGADSFDKEHLEVSARDCDGVAMTARVPASESAASGTADDSYYTKLTYTKVGRIESGIRVALTADGRVLERRAVAPNDLLADDTPFRPLRSTSELIVQIGSTPLGLPQAFPDHDAGANDLGRRVVQLESVEELPTDWFGYEAVDVLVLATGDVELSRAIADDEQRLAAIARWLELGGRLIVVCGRHAPELLAAGRPLARLVPGRFVEMVRLPQTRGLENFAGTADPIGSAGEQPAIPVPLLDDVAGQVEVFGRGNDLPLVIRAPLGFGELTFVGVDLDAGPLADWSGRAAFLQALVAPYAADLDVQASQALVSLGYDDLAGAVRQRLGRAFPGVIPIAFPIVAGLVIGYLLLLGPLDYLFVHKLVRRPLLAWVTFPLLVLLVSGTVMWLAPLRRGSLGSQVNQAELVDVDLATGRVRGTLWATLYSPVARRFDLAFAARLPGGRPAEDAESLLSWLGLPGSGLGGMHARGVELDLTGAGYRSSADRDALSAVPVLTASTKSFTARWHAAAKPLLATNLTADDDGLVVGSLTNETGQTLRDACLLYGVWGYQIGDIAPGKTLDVGPQLKTLQAKTLLARRALPSGQAGRFSTERAIFSAERASTDKLLNVMMFYQALGGYSFAGLRNRYQADCDLSRLLALGRALLVARGEGGGSRLVDEASGEQLGSDQADSPLLYRFVIPIAAGATPSDFRPLTSDP